jgi:CheY-like chemotaxis protein
MQVTANPNSHIFKMASAVALTGPTILIVEDDPDSRRALETLLEDSGYRVLSAADGSQALKALHAGVMPDLILLDMLLPILDGWHFLDQIRNNARWSSIPIVIMTGIVIGLDWAHDHGCAGFLKKPIDKQRLFQEIQQCLQVGAR